MSDKDIEDIVRLHFDENQPDGECPDSETLAAFAEGGLTGDEEDEVAEHMAYCSVCREVLVNLKSIDNHAESAEAAVASTVIKFPVKEYIYAAVSIAAAVLITFTSVSFFKNHNEPVVATAEKTNPSVAQGFVDDDKLERLLVNLGYHFYMYSSDKSYDLSAYINRINSETKCGARLNGEIKFANNKCRRPFGIGALAASIDSADINLISVVFRNRRDVCPELSYEYPGPLSALTSELYDSICIGDIDKLDPVKVKKIAKKIVIYGQD